MSKPLERPLPWNWWLSNPNYFKFMVRELSGAVVAIDLVSLLYFVSQHRTRLLCYAACPVLGLEEDFIGPASLALGLRYNLDSRDQGQKERQEVLASHEAIWHCTFVGECSEVCPKNVDPAGAIQQLKVASTIDWYKSMLLPWGNR